jgi:hypothetical protein
MHIEAPRRAGPTRLLSARRAGVGERAQLRPIPSWPAAARHRRRGARATPIRPRPSAGQPCARRAGPRRRSSGRRHRRREGGARARLLVLRAAPEPAPPCEQAPMTLSGSGPPLDGAGGAPAPVGAVALPDLLVLSVGIAAATAYILRGDHPPVAHKPAAASPPRAPAPKAKRSARQHPGARRPRADPSRTRSSCGAASLRSCGSPRPEPPRPSVDAELCIDRRGKVSSCGIVSEVSAAARATLSANSWPLAYRSLERDGHRVAGCFAVQVPPLRSSDRRRRRDPGSPGRG